MQLHQLKMEFQTLIHRLKGRSYHFDLPIKEYYPSITQFKPSLKKLWWKCLWLAGFDPKHWHRFLSILISIPDKLLSSWFILFGLLSSRWKCSLGKFRGRFGQQKVFLCSSSFDLVFTPFDSKILKGRCSFCTVSCIQSTNLYLICLKTMWKCEIYLRIAYIIKFVNHLLMNSYNWSASLI